MSEADVYRRQILTYRDDPRTERIKIFIMAVDTQHKYSNEPERANQDIYDDFKLKKPFILHRLSKNMSAF